MKKKLLPLIALTLLAALFLAACADTAPTRDVRVTLVDDVGEPVVGAIFYAEIHDGDGAFDFVWAVSGEAGEVPDSAYEPLRIPWRSGAQVSLAAFAPGHRAARRVRRAVRSDHRRPVLVPRRVNRRSDRRGGSASA